MNCKQCCILKKIEIIEQIMRTHWDQPQHFDTLKSLYDQYQTLVRNYEVCEHQFEIIEPP